MSWLATIVKHVDYLRDRYAAFPVRDDATRAGALQGLDEVRRKELRRVHGRGALESAAFVDADVRYELYAVKDTQKDRVVGCIRVTTADQIAPIPESRQEYLLDRFPPALLKRTQIFTRLVGERADSLCGQADMLLTPSAGLSHDSRAATRRPLCHLPRRRFPGVLGASIQLAAKIRGSSVKSSGPPAVARRGAASGWPGFTR